LFLSAAGYHHHVGVNIWHSHGAPPQPRDAAGLVSFSILIPDRAVWETVVQRLANGGLPVERRLQDQEGASVLVRDPSQIGVELANGQAATP
jgi:catechol 2,3-dioxygenase